MYPFGGGSNAAPRRPARPRAFSFTLREPSFAERHVGGVNAVVANAGDGVERLVVTGGRDGTVREWAAPRAFAEGAGTRGAASSVSSFPSEPNAAVTVAHAGWVNAVTPLAGDGDVLVSGGADRAVKLWRRGAAASAEAGEGRGGAAGLALVSTLERHADYVTRLAAPTEASGGSAFLSAGLGADQVFLWDASRSAAKDGSDRKADAPVARFAGQTDSAYALAADATCAVLVTGDVKGVVRRWDARAPRERPSLLKGHAGTVRCASMDPTGRLCLTGSADGAVRLWDLGQGRCVQTLAGTHGCSVWSLAPDRNWKSVVSGGADGAVYVTDLARRRSRLLFREAGGVVELRRDDEAEEEASRASGGEDLAVTVWAATTGTDVTRWSARVAHDEPQSDTEFGSPGGGSSLRARAARLSLGRGAGAGEDGAAGWFAAGTSPGMSPARLNGRTSGGARFGSRSESDAFARGNGTGDDALAARAAVIAGAPPVVAHAQLPDRRRVLARDAAGGLALWDVTAFRVVRRWPPPRSRDHSEEALTRVSNDGLDVSDASSANAAEARFEATLEALKNEAGPVSVPAWFAADARSGSLAVTLAPSGAFQAEGYARELGRADASEETKVNFGVQTLHALLRGWAKRRRDAATRARDPNGDVGEDASNVDATSDARRRSIDARGPCDDAEVFATPSSLPSFAFEPPEPPYDPTSLSVAEGGRERGRAVVLLDGGAMRGTDEEETSLPEWVVDVAAERYAVPDAPKASFYITEHGDEASASASAAAGSTLKSGGKTLTSGKVTAPRVLSVRKVCSYVVAKLGLDLAPDVAVEDAVEIFCDGKKLDPGWSLATVREHVWRRGDDLRVTFRVTDAVAKPAGA